jgi:hypothetical protein
MAMDSSIASWDRLRSFLPQDLDALAREWRAYKRLRGFDCAEDLVRTLLDYAASGASFIDVAAASTAAGRPVSHAALHERLVAAEHFLHFLFIHVAGYGSEPASTPAGTLRAIDATVLCGPGATGSELRLHAMMELGSGRLVSVRITDARVGEHARLHFGGPESFAIGDRAYGSAANLKAFDDAASGYLVRLTRCAMRFHDERGRRVKLAELEAGIRADAPHDRVVSAPVKPPGTKGTAWLRSPRTVWVKTRLVGVRLPGGAVIWFATSLGAAELDAEGVAGLYRGRWQVELMFKRFKSLGGLDRLKSRRNGPSAKAWVYAKLLVAALAQRLVRPNGPVGEPSSKEPPRHGAWSRMRLALGVVAQLIGGTSRLLLASDEQSMLRMRPTPRRRTLQDCRLPLRSSASNA